MTVPSVELAPGVVVGGESLPVSLPVIAGPCVIETEDLAVEMAHTLAAMAERLGIALVFKSSFDKANRTSGKSFRGPGLDAGLRILDDVRRETGLPVTTDVHETHQCAAVGQVCDILQVPAFLARRDERVGPL